MKVIDVYNVDQALSTGLTAIVAEGATCGSRNGPVLRFKTPVTSVYHRPLDRVSFNVVRDANPFLHLMESLWMLAGRNDVEFAAYYAKQMLQYTDDEKTLNGAYGYRWRAHFGYDQLEEAIAELQSTSGGSRRVVVQMWDPGHRTEDQWPNGEGGFDYVFGTGDLRNQKSKDLPCNTAVLFDAQLGVLNATVTNRSNDMIWGAYGANAVQFSMLLEYMANRIGIPVGTYYQVSNNLHVYTEFEISQRFLGTDDAGYFVKAPPFPPDTADVYGQGLVQAMPLGAFSKYWDTELQHLIDNYRTVEPELYGMQFFFAVAGPMAEAYNIYKNGDKQDAVEYLSGAQHRHFINKGYTPNDWLAAGISWLERRLAKA
jgi:thymidylate synthase